TRRRVPGRPVGGDVPVIPGQVPDGALAIAVRLVHDRGEGDRARRDGATVHGVGVGDVEMQRGRRHGPAPRLAAADHDLRGARLERVARTSPWAQKPSLTKPTSSTAGRTARYTVSCCRALPAGEVVVALTAALLSRPALSRALKAGWGRSRRSWAMLSRSASS